MKICYQEKTFRAKSLALINICNVIIEELRAQGYVLTLRQLYYQLVSDSRVMLPNNEQSYDNIGALISDARLAGLVDWDAIIDQTRNPRALPHWDDPSDIIAGSAQQFNYDRWEGQTTRVEVWIEKDALVGVISPTCKNLDVPYFSCRGYTSQSAMWGAAQRIVEYYDKFDDVVILHLGDHDPSGLDMSRDIEDRLTMFCESEGQPAPTIKRIALNRDQIRRYKLPPNPAKLSDCRAAKYIAEHGRESWELDALSPKVITTLLRESIEDFIDPEPFEKQIARQVEARKELALVSANYSRVVKMLKRKNGK